jgi:L-rhamnose mutarotase
MERVCFLGQIRPERIDEYRARHREVWPEMTTPGLNRADMLYGDDPECLT